jgi:hypothetical protein
VSVRLPVLAAVALVTTIAGTAPAVAATPGWSAAGVLSGGDRLPTGPVVRMDGRGGAVVAWVNPFEGVEQRLRVAERSANGRFAAARTLWGPAEVGSPAVAVDQAGDAVLAWETRPADSSDSAIEVATRPAGGSFGLPQPLARGSDGGAVENPRIGESDSGEVVAVWFQTDQDGTTGDVVAIRPAGASAFGPPSRVVDLGGEPVNDAALGVGANGTAVLAFKAADGRLLASVRGPGIGFAAPVALSASEVPGQRPAVAVDGRGGATVVWSRTAFVSPELGDQIAAVQAATLPPGGGFAPGGDVAATGSGSSPPEVAADRAGRTTVVWREEARVRAITRPPDGAFSTPVTLATDQTGESEVHVASSADGATGVTLTAQRPVQTTLVLATVRPPGAAAFGRLCTVAPGDEQPGQPSIAVGPGTDAVVAWDRATRARLQVAASSFADAKGTHCLPGPAISSLRISPVSFRPARRGGSVGRAGPRVRLKLDKRATVVWTVQRLTSKAGRWATMKGSFTTKAKAGRSEFRFTGRLRGRSIAPGYYRLAGSPSAAGVKGATMTADFQIRTQ